MDSPIPIVIVMLLGPVNTTLLASIVQNEDLLNSNELLELFFSYQNGVWSNKIFHRVVESKNEHHHRFSSVKNPYLHLNKYNKYPKNMFFEILGACETIKKGRGQKGTLS